MGDHVNCRYSSGFSSNGAFWIVLSIIFFLFVASPLSAQQTVSVSGITEPINDVTLSSEVVGNIDEIFFEEGDSVRKGQRILNLDKRIEELELQRRKIIWESKAELNSAQEQVKTLRKLLDANRELFEKTRSVSREELDKLDLEYKLAVAEAQRLENTEQRERLEYEMARENVNTLVIRSPINGTIIKIFLEEGETCQENQPLVHLVDAGKCRFVCNLEEAVGRNLKRGQSVELEIRAGDDAVSKTGKIVFVSPVVDSASGLMETKAEFDNADGSVRPGVSGLMKISIP